MNDFQEILALCGRFRCLQNPAQGNQIAISFVAKVNSTWLEISLLKIAVGASFQQWLVNEIQVQSYNTSLWFE